MFRKIIDLVLKCICGSSGDGKEHYRRSYGSVSFEREGVLNIDDGQKASNYEGIAQKMESRKKNESEQAKKYSGVVNVVTKQTNLTKKPRAVNLSGKDIRLKSSVFDYIFGAFHYMNTRAQEVNFGNSVTHEWVAGISLKVKDFCYSPIILVLLALLPFLYMVSPKAVVVVPLLVGLGAVALVVQSFLPVYIGLDFSLMGAVLGSVLFHPWVGVLIVLCTYVAAMMFPNGNQDALEYERIFLFSFLALVIPYIPVSDVMVKCIVATYIGEFLEMFWHKYGEDYPWIMAFLKVFPRSLIYVYVFHRTLGFLV